MKPEELPEVTLLIAAYNEADIILDKVQNSLSLDYPEEKLKIVFVTDGSTDRTAEILSACEGIRLFHAPERKGKLAAVERVMSTITSSVVVLTDANCMLNKSAIKNITRHYSNPSVGGVAGEKSIRNHDVSQPGAGEGLYWRYESWLKKTDSELHSVVGAAGELFSFRRELYETLPSDTIIEDFVLSLKIAMKGYRIVYEPEAVATESPSSSIREEWKRKVRICAGSFQAFDYLPQLWNPFRYGWLSIQFLSHRFLRWAVIPFLIPVMILLTGMLALQSPGYTMLLILEVIILIVSALGILLADRYTIPKVLLIPGYVLMMNAAAYAGLSRYLRGTQSAVWEKSKRSMV